MQLSDRRGYYNYITTSDGTRYRNVHRPQFALSGRTGLSNGLPPVIKLKIQYNVTGIKQYAVNNLIEVEFDLKLRYPIRNGKVQIVVDGVDRDSIYRPHVSPVMKFCGESSRSCQGYPVRNGFIRYGSE